MRTGSSCKDFPGNRRGLCQGGQRRQGFPAVVEINRFCKNRGRLPEIGIDGQVFVFQIISELRVEFSPRPTDIVPEDFDNAVTARQPLRAEQPVQRKGIVVATLTGFVENHIPNNRLTARRDRERDFPLFFFREDSRRDRVGRETENPRPICVGVARNMEELSGGDDLENRRRQRIFRILALVDQLGGKRLPRVDTFGRLKHHGRRFRL